MTVLDIAAKYGILGLIVLLAFAFIAWGLVHWAAAPGKEVSLLWGFASYHKKETPPPGAPQAQPRFSPISVRHAPTNTVWRVMQRPDRWIEADLTRFTSSHVDDVLAGPYHAPCMLDLTYFDLKGSEATYRVLRLCPQCEKTVLPKGVEDRRSHLREAVITLIQQAHFKGHTIDGALVVPVDR